MAFDRLTAVFCLMVLLLPAGSAEEPSTKTVEELTAQLKPSICVVTTRGRENREGLGTGFVVGEGLIATNAHVIGEGRPISVEFADGKKYDAIAIQAHDSKRDLAIIRVDAKNLKPIPLGDVDSIKEGQAAVVLGNPKGLKYSVVSGVISGIREVDGRKMLQIAMPVEPGNSGGPLVDLQGRVQGIVTLKSLLTENLGFAATVNDLQPLLKKPNPVPMSAWVTIGMLDPEEWKSEMGARWTQRAGRILVEEPGTGFGGRSICILRKQPPKVPFEASVSVKLNDEKGAAGILFRHDGSRHYGFYPSGGKIRITRFDGADVYSWKILHDASSSTYRPGEWNTLKVRVEEKGTKFYVNDQLFLESDDVEWVEGRLGLAKFRDTKAEFKGFRVATSLNNIAKDDKAIEKLLDPFQTKLPDAETMTKLAKQPRSSDFLRQKANELEKQASQLKVLAERLQQQRVYDELGTLLTQPEEKIDLIHAALLLAKLDNEEVDIDFYRRDVDKMAKKLMATLPVKADDSDKIKLLNTFFYETRGFHGSRADYYNRSNSYLNEVLDDREGLPITLSVVYMELARRIGLNVVGIGLPGHFVTRQIPKEGEGPFIDVFERGQLLTLEQAKKKAEEFTHGEIDDELLKPVSKKQIIIRMLHNLLRVAQGLQDIEMGLRYLDGILMLDPHSSQDRMMRAGMYLAKGMKPEALADVDFLIDHPSEGISKDKLRQLKRSLEME
jgi:serine protease Do